MCSPTVCKSLSFAKILTLIIRKNERKEPHEFKHVFLSTSLITYPKLILANFTFDARMGCNHAFSSSWTGNLSTSLESPFVWPFPFYAISCCRTLSKRAEKKNRTTLARTFDIADFKASLNEKTLENKKNH